MNMKTDDEDDTGEHEEDCEEPLELVDKDEEFVEEDDVDNLNEFEEDKELD